MTPTLVAPPTLAALSTAEELALEDCLRRFLPTLKQLIPALDQLKHDTKAEIAAAHALVEADGAVRLQAVAYLASLQDALHAL